MTTRGRNALNEGPRIRNGDTVSPSPARMPESAASSTR